MDVALCMCVCHAYIYTVYVICVLILWLQLVGRGCVCAHASLWVCTTLLRASFQVLLYNATYACAQCQPWHFLKSASSSIKTEQQASKACFVFNPSISGYCCDWHSCRSLLLVAHPRQKMATLNQRMESPLPCVGEGTSTALEKRKQEKGR